MNAGNYRLISIERRPKGPGVPGGGDFAEWTDYGVYPEYNFHDLLALERKRSERSGGQFLLVLFHLGGLFGENPRGRLMPRLARFLNSCSRDIDLKGWYDHGSVLGIIYTGISESGIKTIKGKIQKRFSCLFDSEKRKDIDVTFHIFPETGQSQNTAGNDERLYPDLVSMQRSRRISRTAKRTMDITGSLAAILLLLPVFLLIALMIGFTSTGPIIFKQKRVGYMGRKFTFLKFRTMYVNNNDHIHREFVKGLIRGSGNELEEKNNGSEAPVFKIKHDPRVTPVGRWLRKTSLDELPQFFNVLRGDMSLVGPRPPIPYEYQQYSIWHRRRISEIKPGLTGIWQVEGRSKTTFDEMVRMDIRYIRTWSVLLDLKLLLKTPLVMITGKGAY